MPTYTHLNVNNFANALVKKTWTVTEAFHCFNQTYTEHELGLMWGNNRYLTLNEIMNLPIIPKSMLYFVCTPGVLELPIRYIWFKQILDDYIKNYLFNCCCPEITRWARKFVTTDIEHYKKDIPTQFGSKVLNESEKSVLNSCYMFYNKNEFLNSFLNLLTADVFKYVEEAHKKMQLLSVTDREIEDIETASIVKYLDILRNIIS